MPFEPGESGNPSTQFSSDNQPERNGRPKGRRSLQAIIRDVLEQELEWDLINVKNAHELADRYAGRAGWDVLVQVAATQAIAGNTKAMQWLSKNGYGDKIVHEFEKGLFDQNKISIEVTNEPKTETEPSAAPGTSDAG